MNIKNIDNNVIPVSLSESLMYNTVRLEITHGEKISFGTGFIFTFIIDEKEIPIIITNKHVIGSEINREIRCELHRRKKEKDEPSGLNIRVNINSTWYNHPNEDLCFCFLNSVIENKLIDINPFYSTMSEDLIYDINKLKDLSALESVVMVGYPNALWDDKNNFPIFRTGYTASHPGVNYTNLSRGVVNMPCIPGSSGSPVFILNENGFVDKYKGYMISEQRIILLGVFCSGPTFDEVASSKLKSYMNLGYYIKAYEILNLKETIKENMISLNKKE